VPSDIDLCVRGGSFVAALLVDAVADKSSRKVVSSFLQTDLLGLLPRGVRTISEIPLRGVEVTAELVLCGVTVGCEDSESFCCT